MQSGERIVINGRNYRLGSLLSTSAGSYGQVWAATDPAGRDVALKFINTEAMSRVDPALRGHWREHLEREIAFLERLDADQSRHIVTLLDHGQANGQPVLVMERLHVNLGQWLAQQRRESELPPDLERVIDWAGQILDGLDAIHRAGFVYRDLKFSNILVDEDGWLLKLADFGSLSREDGDNTRSFVGTPATMAPEQVLPVRHGAAGSEYAIDYRADYYALGLLLFTLLTDRPTTSAQRRLGQLLALHGQEGAGRQREQLGSLDEEERELLRWSIEFWTIPALPEQGRSGAAALLTDLIDRLLARDPPARPAHSAEIRAVLAATRGAPSPMVAEEPGLDEPSPATPPNRRSYRSNGAIHSSQPWFRRSVGLATAFGLAGALAWAVFIQPGDWLPTSSEPPGLARPAPDPAPIAEPESTPVDESAPALIAAPETEPAPVEPELIPAEEPAVVTTTTPETEPAPEPGLAAPEIVSAPPPAQPPAAKAPATAASPKAPVVEERSAPARPRTPAPTAATARPAPVERRPTPPPAAPRVAQPAPKASPTPTTDAPRGAPPATTRTAPAPRTTPSSTARAAPAAPAAPRPAAASASAGPVPPAKPPASPSSPSLPPIELTSRQPSPPALPPIELTSRQPSPPPIELVSRSSGRPATQRPPARIELIGRPTPPPAQPQPPPRASSANPPASRPPARSSAPVANRNSDIDRLATGVRREAEAFTDWVGRASTTIGTEVQRGLESANQALNPRPRGNNTRVERRDQQYRPRAE